MKAQKRAAFTLVELLVVIAIIGILVSLLVPAVGITRRLAQKTYCLNNLKQVGMAMNGHAIDKNRYPGRLDGVPTQRFPRTTVVPGQPVTWAAKILPYIDQAPLWDRLLADGEYLSYVDVYVCPSNPPPTKQGPVLSYAANTGIWDRRDMGNEDFRANGVCHDLFTMFRTGKHRQAEVAMDYISRNDGVSQTVLVSENIDATMWAPRRENNQLATEADHGMVWFAVQEQFLGINRQLGEGPLDGNDPRFARPSSRHSGGVNAIFCDGHGAFISEDVDFRVYGQLLTPEGMKSWHYDANGTPPFQMQLVLQSDMYTN